MSVSGSCGDLGRAATARALARRASRGRTASARAGSASCARYALVVERELLVPGPGLDLRLEHRARTRPPPPPPPREQEADRLLAAPRRGGRAGWPCARGSGSPSRRRRGEAEVEQHRGDRHRDVHRQRLAPRLGDGVAEAARRAATCGPLTPRSSASSRIRSARGSTGRCTGWPKPGTLPPAAWISRAIRSPTARAPRPRRPAAAPREQPRAVLRRAEDDRAAAEDPGRDRALQRLGVGGERHPRGDVRRHQPVLGDRDEQQVEEEALVLGRLLAGEQQVEVLGEAEPAHEVAGRGRGRAPRRGRGRPG